MIKLSLYILLIINTKNSIL